MHENKFLLPDVNIGSIYNKIQLITDDGLIWDFKKISWKLFGIFFFLVLPFSKLVRQIYINQWNNPIHHFYFPRNVTDI